MDSSIQTNINNDNGNGGNDTRNGSQSMANNNVNGLNTPIGNGGGAGSSAANRHPMNDFDHPSSAPPSIAPPPHSTRPLPYNQSPYDSQQFHQSQHGFPPQQQQQQQHNQFPPYYRTAENNVGRIGTTSPNNNDMYNTMEQQGYGGVYGSGGMNPYDGSNMYNQYASHQQQQQQQPQYNMNVMDGYDGNMMNRNIPQSSTMQQSGHGMQQQQHAGTMSESGNYLKGDVKGSGIAKGGSDSANTITKQDQLKQESPDKSSKSYGGSNDNSGTSPQQVYGVDGVGRAKTESSDHLAVAKACLNLRQDGKEDQQEQLQQQQQQQQYPGGYPPDMNPSNSARYPQQYHQYPFHQAQQPYPPHSSFQQQQQYQQSGAMYMPQRYGGEGQQNDFSQGYFPNPMSYGNNYGPNGGMTDFLNPYMYQTSNSDEYNRQMMMQLASGGIGVGGDVGNTKGMKRPFDQLPSSSGSVGNEKRSKKSSRSDKSEFAENIVKVKKGKRPTGMPKRPLSAYNFFFSEERERVLKEIPDPDGEPEEEPTDGDGKVIDAEDAIKNSSKRLLELRGTNDTTRRAHRKTHGKIGFKDLAKLIGERWRALDIKKREYYAALADKDLGRYKDQMKEYHQNNNRSYYGEE